MSSITGLLETAIIADLLQDTIIGQYPVQPHDFALLKSGGEATDEEPIIVVVTAYDMGDYDHTYGAGIRKIHIEVQISANLISPDYAATLDTLDERISGWLQPSTTLDTPGREETFSGPELKVFGILSTQETLRHDIDLIRQRTVQRIFIAAKIG